MKNLKMKSSSSNLKTSNYVLETTIVFQILVPAVRTVVPVMSIQILKVMIAAVQDLIHLI